MDGTWACTVLTLPKETPGPLPWGKQEDAPLTPPAWRFTHPPTQRELSFSAEKGAPQGVRVWTGAPGDSHGPQGRGPVQESAAPESLLFVEANPRWVPGPEGHVRATV